MASATAYWSRTSHIQAQSELIQHYRSNLRERNGQRSSSGSSCSTFSSRLTDHSFQAQLPSRTANIASSGLPWSTFAHGFTTFSPFGSGRRSPSILSRILSLPPSSWRSCWFSLCCHTFEWETPPCPGWTPCWSSQPDTRPSGDWYPPLTCYPAQGPLPGCLGNKFLTQMKP